MPKGNRNQLVLAKEGEFFIKHKTHKKGQETRQVYPAVLFLVSRIIWFFLFSTPPISNLGSEMADECMHKTK